MANTYFKLKKTVHTETSHEYNNYTNEYSLSLTAFVGKEKNSVQLTVQCNSTMPNMTGIGFITLSEEDVDKLIVGLLERRMRISATGNEQSVICPDED